MGCTRRVCACARTLYSGSTPVVASCHVLRPPPMPVARSSLHLHVHLDQYSANDLKVFFQIMKKAGNFKSIKLSLGQTSLDLSACCPSVAPPCPARAHPPLDAR